MIGLIILPEIKPILIQIMLRGNNKFDLNFDNIKNDMDNKKNEVLKIILLLKK